MIDTAMEIDVRNSERNYTRASFTPHIIHDKSSNLWVKVVRIECEGKVFMMDAEELLQVSSAIWELMKER